MSWRAELVYNYVEQHPGLSAYEVALALRMPESTVYGALISAEREGLLMYEDEGKLFIMEEANSEKEMHL